jgi:hypothetical protein
MATAKRMTSARRQPATLWKMVDAQCTQLADAVSVARIPFLLSLLWAFIWAWSLYSAEFGYLGSFYRERLDSSLSHSKESGTAGAYQFKIDCNRVTLGSLAAEIEADRKVELDKRPALNAEKQTACVAALDQETDMGRECVFRFHGHVLSWRIPEGRRV